MRILLTGSSGLIGSHIRDLLLNDQHEVSIMVRSSANAVNQPHHPALKIFLVDYFLPETLYPAVVNQNVIIHCAGVTKVKKRSDFFRYNTELTENLINASKTVNPELKLFIYFSSLSAVGPTQLNQPLSETQPAKPISWYGKSKLQAEEILRQSGLYFTIVRPSVVYGPKDKDVFIYFKLLNHHLAPVIGNGKQQVSVIHVDDVASAVMRILDRLTVCRNKTYFLSDGKIYDWLVFRETLQKLIQSDNRMVRRLSIPLFLVYPIAWGIEMWNGWWGRISSINRDKVTEMRQAAWICSIKQAEIDIAFEPSFNLEKGLKNTWLWYQNHHWI